MQYDEHKNSDKSNNYNNDDRTKEERTAVQREQGKRTKPVGGDRQSKKHLMTQKRQEHQTQMRKASISQGIKENKKTNKKLLDKPRK